MDKLERLAKLQRSKMSQSLQNDHKKSTCMTCKIFKIRHTRNIILLLLLVGFRTCGGVTQPEPFILQDTNRAVVSIQRVYHAKGTLLEYSGSTGQ